MSESQDHLVYLCGGEVDAAEFVLDISSENLQPSEITNLLNLTPTDHFVRGEPHGDRGMKYKFGGWRFSTGRLDLRAGKSLQEQFNDFILILPGEASISSQISAKHDARVIIYAWMRTWNREFDLSSAALGELARRSLSLHVDTYLESDDED